MQRIRKGDEVIVIAGRDKGTKAPSSPASMTATSLSKALTSSRSVFVRIPPSA